MRRSTRWRRLTLILGLGLGLSAVETAASETRRVTPAVIGAPSLDIGYGLLRVGSEAGILYAVQVPF